MLCSCVSTRMASFHDHAGMDCRSVDSQYQTLLSSPTAACYASFPWIVAHSRMPFSSHLLNDASPCHLSLTITSGSSCCVECRQRLSGVMSTLKAWLEVKVVLWKIFIFCPNDCHWLDYPFLPFAVVPYFSNFIPSHSNLLYFPLLSLPHPSLY